jgi:hypothetical protein
VDQLPLAATQGESQPHPEAPKSKRAKSRPPRVGPDATVIEDQLLAYYQSDPQEAMQALVTNGYVDSHENVDEIHLDDPESTFSWIPTTTTPTMPESMEAIGIELDLDVEELDEATSV